MKKMLIIAVSVVAVVLVLGFAKDMVIKISIEKGVEIVTGLKLNIGSLGVGILKTQVDIRNLRLFNPVNFKDRTMLDMPEIYVAYNLPSIIKGKIYLPKARIVLKEFVVVKNENGDLNIDSLKVVQAQKEGKKPAEKSAEKAPEIQIDSLYLDIGKVVYKDYTGGGEPRIKEFNVNINEEYKDITNPYSLVSLIVVKALMNTTIANITDFDLNGLSGTVSDTLGGAQKAAAQVVTTAEKGIQTAADTARTAETAAKETVNALTDVFKNPFGAGK